MALENVLNCPLCGSSQFNNFLICQDYTTSQEKFNLRACVNCNFVLTSPRPDQYSLGNYYKSDSYVSHTGTKKGLLNFIYLYVRRYTLRWKVSILKSFYQSGSLLDYGCGTGEFLHQSRESGFDVTGVEPSADARKKAETLLEQSIHEDINRIANKKFDCITLWHVLEHVGDLKEKLLQLKNLLTDRGIIFIAVPNHECFDATLYKEHWAGYDVPRHLWHFSKDNMKALLSDLNLTLLEIKPMKLDSFYVSLLSENYKYKEKSSVAKVISGFKNGLKSNRFAAKKMNYSSLIYIARP